MRAQSGGARRREGVVPAERLSAALAGAALAVGPVARRLRPELGPLLDERRRADAVLERWGRGRTGGSTIWLHGASAGELLGAAPAIAALRSDRPAALVVTHFSPSGRDAVERLSPDLASFAPLDVPARCERAVAGVRPDLLVLAKHDVWPALVGAAVRARVPVCLINAVVGRRSRRLRAPSRSLLRSTYARLSAAGAASGGDLERLVSLGLRPGTGRVTGDASFDLALARADAARAPGGAAARLEAALPARPPGGARLIAGSTWPDDEAAILDSLGALPATSEARFAWQAVLVPHRPTGARVEALAGRARAAGHPVARWSRREEIAALPAHGIVLVDEVGFLAELYAAGDAAYVGGGLGRRGLHNVLEPAAAGLPVIFGPRHDRREARELERAGGGRACEPAALSACLTRLGEAAERARLGRRARGCVEAGSGAAAASADLMASLLDAPR